MSDVRDDAIPIDPMAAVLESAARLGVELDARRGSAVDQSDGRRAQGGDVVVDVDTGIFGHRATMLDFDAATSTRFRKIGHDRRLRRTAENVPTALALSGSAAQSRIQAYPGDRDFFERIHITAPTREEACAILARRHPRQGARHAARPDLPAVGGQVRHLPRGRRARTASRQRRQPDLVDAGEVAAGEHDVADRRRRRRRSPGTRPPPNPGWCKLDWIVADPTRGQLANASNMLDSRGRRRTARSSPLDGFLDPYFQEVYLERGVAAAVHRIVERPVGRRGRRLRRRSSSTRSGSTASTTHELGQGRAPPVQHLPADRPLRRGGLHPRAVRRADDRAVPDCRADPHARRGGRRDSPFAEDTWSARPTS